MVYTQGFAQLRGQSRNKTKSTVRYFLFYSGFAEYFLIKFYLWFGIDYLARKFTYISSSARTASPDAMLFW